MIEETLEDIYKIFYDYCERNCNKKSYNIFKVLEITEREVLMCRVLADFLNPEGFHGKGSKYLKMFLEKIIHREDAETICASAHVFKEYKINEDRRIDIVIEALDTFIPIEVKIHAPDQKAQCYDYYMYTKGKDRQPKVIYLTKWGLLPSEDSLCSADGEESIFQDAILCISFAEDICNFMKMVIASEDDGLIKTMAMQYSEAIKEFTIFVDEELQMEVVDKICENERNFRSMIIIEKSAKKAKANLICSVMEEFETQFFPLLKKYGLKKETNFEWYDYKSQATEDYYNQSKSTYPGLNYVFSDIHLSDEIQVWFRIEIDYNLFAGVCLFDANAECELDIGIPLDRATQNVKEKLLTYMNLGEAQYEDWWVQYWYLPTGYSHAKLEGYKIPDFKNMNEAAIALSDKDKRTQFVQECISVIDRELHKLLNLYETK